MFTNEFDGELKEIDPARLIKDGVEDEVADFFLVLAIIYNDFKGLIFFKTLLQDKFRNPPNGERSYHSGEYAGFQIQLHKLICATIHEFFEFLKKKEDVLKTHEFTIIANNLSSYTKSRWTDIVDFALSKNTPDSDFKNRLARVRSNVTSHYYESDKNLRSGFVDFFFKRERDAGNENAYYAIDNAMKNTRFFYADAAEDAFLNSISKTEEMPTAADFSEGLIEIINAMNETIALLLKEYLRRRPHR